MITQEKFQEQVADTAKRIGISEDECMRAFSEVLCLVGDALRESDAPNRQKLASDLSFIAVNSETASDLYKTIE